MTIDGRKAPVEVAFGEPGKEAVLGATALEILGFVVDPVGKKLVPRNLLALGGRLEEVWLTATQRYATNVGSRIRMAPCRMAVSAKCKYDTVLFRA